tara:strand:- start:639 stop:932 length:294 start_codon:yes stop_codon:yes gene_type:complete
MTSKTKILICCLITFIVGIFLVKIFTDIEFFNNNGLAGKSDGDLQAVFVLSSLTYGGLISFIPMIIAFIFRKKNWFKIYLISLVSLSSFIMLISYLA